MKPLEVPALPETPMELPISRVAAFSPKRNISPFWIAAAAVIAFAGGIGFWLTRGEKEPVASGQGYPYASVIDLLALYHVSEEVADGQYKGQILRVEGVVEEIEKELGEEPALTFESGREFQSYRVRCMFDAASSGRLAELKKGQRVTVQGKVTGFEKEPVGGNQAKRKPVVRNYRKLMMRECSLIE